MCSPPVLLLISTSLSALSRSFLLALVFLSLALPVSLVQSGGNFRGIRLAWLIGGRWQTKGKRATVS